MEGVSAKRQEERTARQSWPRHQLDALTDALRHFRSERDEDAQRRDAYRREVLQRIEAEALADAPPQPPPEDEKKGAASAGKDKKGAPKGKKK